MSDSNVFCEEQSSKAENISMENQKYSKIIKKKKNTINIDDIRRQRNAANERERRRMNR